MQCPSCRFEQADGNETCEACGLIFAKWRERNAPPPPETPGPGPAPSGPEPAAAPPLENPPPAETNPWKKPLPERQYQEFPLKKMILLAVPLLLGAALYSFWPTPKTDGYATPKPIERPTSIYGNATEEPSPEATWTPLPCGYPDATCTPTPIATPMTIAGPSWQFHGKVLDCLHLSTISGAVIVFSNNGVAVTATTNEQGFYHVTVPPLSAPEAYEVRISHPNFGERYWTDDPSGLDVGARMAKAYEEPPNQSFRGTEGGGDQAVDFSMFPYQLSEQERMQLQNARPPSQP
ncbi:MAG TPA: carboxypeptidase-like regulatory domain-containing protein [bacterium]|nr:carboxypeptidase-like regulatory domain-containing protein [bacterium]